MVREYIKELQDKKVSRSTELKGLKMAKKEPLAPYPIKAILTTQKAKW
jgi:hypothetical protein